MKKRIGKLCIYDESVQVDYEPFAESLAAIRFFPYRVEHRMDLGCFEMIGVSKSFDEIKPGEPIPFYEIVVDVTAGGKQTIEVVRREE